MTDIYKEIAVRIIAVGKFNAYFKTNNYFYKR